MADAPPLTALTEALSDLGERAQSLADEVHSDRLQRRQESRRMLVVMVIFGLILALMVGISIYNRILGNQNRAIMDRIVSCTTAGGKCYEDGQKRSGKLIKQMMEADIVVASCARDTKTDEELHDCVNKRLAELAKEIPR